MLTLYYSPHSTSVDNEAHRASGQADVPLSEVGKRQAQELGQHYASMKIDAVFCSDLQRASTTAQIAFSERKLPIIPDARLRECDYGKLTQCPTDQIDEAFMRYISEPFPEGQSVMMAVEGVGDFLREVWRNYDGKTVVVVGHRATKYGIEYWNGNSPLEEIIETPWEWRDIPIWRYEFEENNFNRPKLITKSERD